MRAGTQTHVFTKTMTVLRGGSQVGSAVYVSALYPAAPDTQLAYNIQSPRLGFTLWTAAGLNIQAGDQLNHEDGTLYVVGLATWGDALEITAEKIQ